MSGTRHWLGDTPQDSSEADSALDEELCLDLAQPPVERLANSRVLHESGVIIDDQRGRHTRVDDEVAVGGDPKQAQARLAARLVATQHVALAAQLEVDPTETRAPSHSRWP